MPATRQAPAIYRRVVTAISGLMFLIAGNVFEVRGDVSQPNLQDDLIQVWSTGSGSGLHINRQQKGYIDRHGNLALSGSIALGLANCDTIDSTSTGMLICGIDQNAGTFGSGNVLTIGDNRYVKKAGDTMTGTLVIQNGNTHTPTNAALLNVRGTISGAVLRASSGALIGGNVGIGTLVAKAKLDVVGTISGSQLVSSALTSGSVLLAGPYGRITQSNANLYWDSQNNRLGVGTASPGSIFHVRTNTNPQIRIERPFTANDNASNPTFVFLINGGSTAAGYFGMAGGTNGLINGSVQGDLNIRSTNKNILFSTDDGTTAHMYIKSTGNIGIGGTTNPKAKLHVVGTISGSALTVSSLISGSGGLTVRGNITFRSLTGCTGLQTDGNGLLSCSTISSGAATNTGTIVDSTTLTNPLVYKRLNLTGSLLSTSLNTTGALNKAVFAGNIGWGTGNVDLVLQFDSVTVGRCTLQPSANGDFYIEFSIVTRSTGATGSLQVNSQGTQGSGSNGKACADAINTASINLTTNKKVNLAVAFGGSSGSNNITLQILQVISSGY